MTKQHLQKKLARLETFHDQLLSELGSIDLLMRNVGFPQGIASLKSTAEELYSRRAEEGDSF